MKYFFALLITISSTCGFCGDLSADNTNTANTSKSSPWDPYTPIRATVGMYVGGMAVGVIAVAAKNVETIGKYALGAASAPVAILGGLSVTGVPQYISLSMMEEYCSNAAREKLGSDKCFLSAANLAFWSRGASKMATLGGDVAKSFAKAGFTQTAALMSSPTAEAILAVISKLNLALAYFGGGYMLGTIADTADQSLNKGRMREAIITVGENSGVFPFIYKNIDQPLSDFFSTK